MNVKLKDEIKNLLNKYSAEDESNTPDHVLAEYIANCLDAFDLAVNSRDSWYNISPEPGWEIRRDPVPEF